MGHKPLSRIEAAIFHGAESAFVAATPLQISKLTRFPLNDINLAAVSLKQSGLIYMTHHQVSSPERLVGPLECHSPYDETNSGGSTFTPSTETTLIKRVLRLGQKQASEDLIRPFVITFKNEFYDGPQPDLGAISTHLQVTELLVAQRTYASEWRQRLALSGCVKFPDRDRSTAYGYPVWWSLPRLKWCGGEMGPFHIDGITPDYALLGGRGTSGIGFAIFCGTDFSANYDFRDNNLLIDACGKPDSANWVTGKLHERFEKIKQMLDVSQIPYEIW